VRQILRNGGVELSIRCAPSSGSSSGKGKAPTLLLLHGLFGSGSDWGRLESIIWPGDVLALDFAGHGDSDWLPGRGYVPEFFAADADAVLAWLGVRERVRVAGVGVGAYVALLLAGARADVVEASLLLPGRGLAGGGALPSDLSDENEAAWLETLAAPERAADQTGPDPLVARCERDVRPTDYAAAFATAARKLLVPEVPDAPPWLRVAAEHATHAQPLSLRVASSGGIAAGLAALSSA
jgi:pimeloyl-ACP methyl ester carboxylesterase